MQYLFYPAMLILKHEYSYIIKGSLEPLLDHAGSVPYIVGIDFTLGTTNKEPI